MPLILKSNKLRGIIDLLSEKWWPINKFISSVRQEKKSNVLQMQHANLNSISEYGVPLNIGSFQPLLKLWEYCTRVSFIIQFLLYKSFKVFVLIRKIWGRYSWLLLCLVWGSWTTRLRTYSWFCDNSDRAQVAI